MTKTLTLFFIALSLNTFLTEAQSIPNNGFEDLNSDGTLSNWGNVYLSTIWFDSTGASHTDSVVYDNQYYAPTNDANAGTTALELRNAWNFTTNTGIAGAVASDDDSVFNSWGLLNLVPTYSTPFTPFAPFNFGFYYKYFPVNGDSAWARIALWDSSGNQLAEGEVIIFDAASSYTLIYSPINYFMTGDAAFYSFSISTFYSSVPGSHQPGFGTRLLVDDIGFDFISTTGLRDIKEQQQISIYPNPANDHININANVNKPAPFKIYNMSCQLLMEGSLNPNTNCMSLNNFDEGVYMIEINKDGKTECQSFVVGK